MPFWRRRRALHEELAEGTGLLDWRSSYEAGGLFKGTLDVLHGGRQREWDAVATAEAPGIDLDAVEFTALPDGALLVDEDVPDRVLAPLAEAVESSLPAPYRARAVRSDGNLWSIAANKIDVLEVPEEIDGDVVSLAVQGADRTLLVDDRPVWADVPTLAAFATERHPDFVLQAERLDGNLWAVKVNPL